ncbi:glutamyl-Q tRNA(Asp) synthetase [Humitalea rosea]|uniref:Glutamyl-Q tRNA(Asp) synthetase n=1 Tax=Humitalea rosea TaxID=990373 RepID=A0A2W7JBF2_9PROT|nr:tRNA glutamyl-Q(34) synthetase GluQRS [Humitalea rosea]PZW49011.1 glutamyl-Q tRNA(Asp) synthetase [Humitalea rosea]
MTLTTRFAPSPTGLLHLGHAHSALAGFSAARAAGGRFLLRIEDIDSQRCRPEFTEAILRDLDWLGLEWDGAVRVQSRHMAEYRAVLEALDARGLLYPCVCTRADIAAAGAAPHGPEGAVYPGTCRDPTRAQRAARLAQPHALRLDMGRALAVVPGDLWFCEAGRGRLRCDPARFGDVVLARKDTPASYHLCVTHDDAVQGVTLVTRGEDLLAATDVQRLLQALCGWPEPHYAHHRLLTDGTGRRLAKRDGAATLASLREAGRSPAEVRAMAGWPGQPARSPSIA